MSIKHTVLCSELKSGETAEPTEKIAEDGLAEDGLDTNNGIHDQDHKARRHGTDDEKTGYMSDTSGEDDMQENCRRREQQERWEPVRSEAKKHGCRNAKNEILTECSGNDDDHHTN